MSTPDLHAIIQIPDPQVDAGSVLQRVQARLEERRLQAQAQGMDYDHLLSSSGETDARHDSLAQMQRAAEEIWVTVNVRDEKLPVINSLWQRMKGAFHQMVVMYVNTLAGRQAVFNVATTRLLQESLARQEEQEARLRALEAEVAALRRQRPSAPGEESQQP